MDHTVEREGKRSIIVHQYLPYLAYQAQYQRLRATFVSEISWDLNRYIKIEMDFLDILSLGTAYRYVVKTKKKFKHYNKWDFGYTYPEKEKYEKDCHNKQPSKNHSKPQEKEGNEKEKQGH
jgi:hypothetical protein